MTGGLKKKYSLSPDIFNQSFPFHMVLDKDLVILEHGSSLAKLLGDDIVGEKLDLFFKIKLPRAISFDRETFLENLKNTFIIETLDEKLLLRGGFVTDTKCEELFYLCSPWVLTPDELENIGLSLRDFPPHDPQYDMLVQNQLLRQNFDDVSLLSERLKNRTVELEYLNKELDNIIADKTLSLRKSLVDVEVSKKQLSQILDSISDIAIFMTDAEGEILSWNTGCNNLFDVSITGPGHYFNSIIEEESASFDQCKNQKDMKIVLHTEESEKIINLTSNKIVSDSEVSYTFVLQNMTQKLAVERIKNDIAKFEALGQLTGGLAHDFNNLLAIIVASLDTLEDSLVENKFGRSAWEMAHEASSRAAEITKTLLKIYQKNELKYDHFDLKNCIEKTLPLLRSSLSHEIELTTDLCSSDLVAELDDAFFSNCLLNLVINARDAIVNQESKHICLTTEKVKLPVNTGTLLETGWYGAVTVGDNGSGIDPNIVDKIKEPFFTTKENKGTGLGLSMVDSFMRQLGGYLNINSTVGKGTLITLYFPLYEKFAEKSLEEQNNKLLDAQDSRQNLNKENFGS